MTAEWTAEAAEVADASPTLGSPWIPVHEGDAFVPFSFEVQGEAVNFIQELGKLLQDGADQLTVTAYTTGSGSGQPKGVITALVAASGTVGLVAPATAETFAPADVYAVQSALPPRFQARGVERPLRASRLLLPRPRPVFVVNSDVVETTDPTPPAVLAESAHPAMGALTRHAQFGCDMRDRAGASDDPIDQQLPTMEPSNER